MNPPSILRQVRENAVPTNSKARRSRIPTPVPSPFSTASPRLVIHRLRCADGGLSCPRECLVLAFGVPCPRDDPCFIAASHHTASSVLLCVKCVCFSPPLICSSVFLSPVFPLCFLPHSSSPLALLSFCPTAPTHHGFSSFDRRHHLSRSSLLIHFTRSPLTCPGE